MGQTICLKRVEFPSSQKNVVDTSKASYVTLFFDIQDDSLVLVMLI